MGKKKIITTEPCIYSPPPYTAEQQETDFKRDYEFNKSKSVRSPASPWEDKYIRQGDARAPKKEVSLVKGTPSSFRGIRTGNSYGKRQAVRRNTGKG